MYYLYCIAYRISDEIKAKKEAEKPFWWENLHPDAKDQAIDIIEKDLLEAHPAEKVAQMTKGEKYLVVSECFYAGDLAEAKKAKEELESLKKEVERSKTNFLTQQTLSPQSVGATAVVQQENLEPIVLGQNIAPAIPSVGGDPSAVKTDVGGFPMPGDAPIKLDDNQLNSFSSQVKDDDLKDDSSPFGGALPGDAKVPSTAPSKAELRRHAQSIVAKAVGEINAKADQIPDDVAVMKEQELLQAVIDELKAVNSKQQQQS